MTMTLPILLCVAAIATAADPLATEKPDPVAKAKQLLAGAYEAASTATPEMQVVTLYHLADNYQSIDKTKSLEIAKQAFAATSQMPATYTDHTRGVWQAEIIRLIAPVDVSAAMELTRQIPGDVPKAAWDPRWRAVDSVTRELVRKCAFEQALSFIEEIGSTGFYTFTAARTLFTGLPEGHELRGRVFASALAAFHLRPVDTFIRDFLPSAWRGVSPQAANEALDAALRFVLDRKRENTDVSETLTIASALGIAMFGSPEEEQLFEIMSVIRAIQPKRLDDILIKYPNLRSLSEQWPDGKLSLDADSRGLYVFTTRDKNTTAAQAQARAWQSSQALIASREQAALGAAKHDFDQALAIAATIPDAARQADVYGNLVRMVAGKNVAQGKIALGKALKVMEDAKSRPDRSAAFASLVDAALAMKDTQLAQQVLDRAMADADHMFKAEQANAEAPNPVLRENWPSTQAYRRVFYRATKMMGVDAEPMLARITDADLSLLLRIEVAQALLERPQTLTRTQIPRIKRK
jgi:hypothetical protein